MLRNGTSQRCTGDLVKYKEKVRCKQVTDNLGNSVNNVMSGLESDVTLWRHIRYLEWL